jgi:TPR repeat protein
MNFVFDSEHFPILKLLEPPPGIPEDVLARFKKAGTGSDEEKFMAALDIYTLVNGDPKMPPPEGCTPALVEQTRKQCLEVFRDCATRNHVDSIRLVSHCYLFGHGCEENPALSIAWWQKGDRLSKPARSKGPSL